MERFKGPFGSTDNLYMNLEVKGEVFSFYVGTFYSPWERTLYFENSGR